MKRGSQHNAMMRWHCSGWAPRMICSSPSMNNIMQANSVYVCTTIIFFVFISIYLHTHFFSASLLPTRVATLFSVSFSTSFDTLGNLFFFLLACIYIYIYIYNDTERELTSFSISPPVPSSSGHSHPPRP